MVAWLGAGIGQGAEVNLSLADYIARVLRHNENIQMRILEAAISRKQYEAAKGAFEPVFISEGSAEDRRRALTEEQKRNLFFASVFNERNKAYESAVELLTPIGTKVRLGYNLRKMNNNLNNATFPDGEFMSTVGISVTQPLMKDAFDAGPMANIRAAAINSDITFQEYRKALMEVVAKAEAAYWDVYLGQQQHAFTLESVNLAQTIFQDNKARVGVGKSSELDVLQAEAGLAERQALEIEARQKLYEAVNRAMIFYSGSVLAQADRLRAVDEPKVVEPASDPLHYRTRADRLNPDWLALRQQLSLEDVRIAFAKNQTLPQLDLKGSYGASGIDGSWAGSFNAIEQQTFPTWMIGLELRLPLMGNIKARRELEAARLRRKGTELAMQTFGIQLDNNIDAAQKTAAAYYNNVKSYAKIVEFNQDLLKTQLARLEVGKIDSRTVLETERDLFEAKLGLVQSQMRCVRAMLDLEQAVGMILDSRQLEITRAELSQRTSVLLRDGRITPQAYNAFLEATRKAYERRKETTPPASP